MGGKVMRAIGIDIGTTTICAVIVDAKTGEIMEAITLDNDSFLTTEFSWERVQDASIILTKVEETLYKLSAKYAPIGAIGFTGQMHGILYTDKDGNAVSPLYTWQDGRGDIKFNKDKTYVEFLSEKTGYKLATGYGAVTHFYNFDNEIISKNACYFCTIHDYVAMKLVGGNIPMINNTNAASLGLFDLEDNCFDDAAINKIGLSKDMFPKVIRGAKKIGKTIENIPVIVAIGDNQASFIGSVRNMEDSILINVGTGSQISLSIESYTQCMGSETRPSVDNDFLIVGSSLCGGRAYALLKEFFNSLIYTVTGKKCDNIYRVMEEMAEKAIHSENKLKISTTFSGTRDNPIKRGVIENLAIDNFTPEHFIIGILEGIVNELFNLYREMSNASHKRPGMLIGSGNGIRKNIILQRILSEKFNMPIIIPLHKEEASFGAALFALIGIGYFKDIAEAQRLIKYQGE
jgi:sedoheptulokinase